MGANHGRKPWTQIMDANHGRKLWTQKSEGGRFLNRPPSPFCHILCHTSCQEIRTACLSRRAKSPLFGQGKVILKENSWYTQAYAARNCTEYPKVHRLY